jgi:hypothetical protein
VFHNAIFVDGHVDVRVGVEVVKFLFVGARPKNLISEEVAVASFEEISPGSVLSLSVSGVESNQTRSSRLQWRQFRVDQ